MINSHQPVKTYHSILALSVLSSLLSTGCETFQPKDPEFYFSQEQSVQPAPDPHNFSAGTGDAMIGELYQVNPQKYDTLSDIARHFGFGYQELVIANPAVDPWLLNDSQPITLPMRFILPDAPKSGIILNLASMRLFYFADAKHSQIMTFPVGIGRDDWDTPLGVTKIIEKKVNPDWTPPPSIIKEHQELNDPLPSVVKSGPDNPLGYYAMSLGFKNYLIHGTNKPYGIGMQVSHGCIQLYPEDIELLFNKVKVGTSVRIVHQPYLAAWSDNHLYVEAHPPIEKWAGKTAELQKEFRKKLEKLATQHHLKLGWEQVKPILSKADGIPTLVGESTPVNTANQPKILEHPDNLLGVPTPVPVGSSDWSVKISGIDDYDTAQKLSAMLNHQGPIIPSYVEFENGQHHVVSGPFKTKTESQKVAKRIQKNFEMNAVVVPPNSSPHNG